MTEPIALTSSERRAAIEQMRECSSDGYGYGFGTALDDIIRAINTVRAENAVFRALSRDLKRLTESNTPYDDQARDLMGSYDIRPKS